MDSESSFHHYLPVGDEVMRWGTYVTGAGREVSGSESAYPAPGHPTLYDFSWKDGRTLPEFQLHLVSEGHGVFESQPTGRLEIRPGSLFFLVPGIWHRYRPSRSTGWTARWLSFNGEVPHRLLDLELIDPSRAVVPVVDTVDLSNSFDRLLARIRARPSTNTVVLAMHATALIAETIELAQFEERQARESLTTPEANGDELVMRAIELIWTHAHQNLSVSRLAERLCVTRRTLDRRFMAGAGHSVLTEINECRLSRARRLLSETQLQIKTVVQLAGFSSVERMRVMFQQREGCSPTEFRER